ncbi:hypothetical protein PGTUg99_015210 [Puccinia graminis f. sp. tritici]|uniref:Uncharacterized protein n=1 Tax=Puccinia graminis f. sp. tritici TaxID=56615 RepID=A0A5B0SLG1_PUCGR|nr:hypothetical protein PGTUg99_011062 [Puccinia graminis f. sp. tritici]KAA1137444.1 hypothetical protein PGTUg99_015210 [Puccinia graminis f. sp. tritici]
MGSCRRADFSNACITGHASFQCRPSGGFGWSGDIVDSGRDDVSKGLRVLLRAHSGESISGLMYNIKQPLQPEIPNRGFIIFNLVAEDESIPCTS